MINSKKHIVVTIAGGTGSGKTTLSRSIEETLGEDNVSYLSHDFYYKDLSHLSREEREVHNYDHPSALDTNQLVEDIKSLVNGRTINVPIYDFKTHTRCTKKTKRIEPKHVILLDGIMLLNNKDIRELSDIKIYVDVASDLRFIRRLQRDIQERDRTYKSVVDQYLKTVRPMHQEFVEPSKEYADIIVPHGGRNQSVIRMIVLSLSN